MKNKSNKSSRRPLTGAALASATKQLEADVEKRKFANERIEEIKRLVSWDGRVSLSDLPDDPLVLQVMLRELVSFFLRARDRDAETLRAEKAFRITLVTEHSSRIAEATETINALKVTLRSLLK
jgi:hypothetical protein